MSLQNVVTPEWVKDAVFYQIFPDRFARSERVVKPPRLEPWDTPPTARGFKGGDLLGVEEHLDYLVDLGITALYFNPIFQSASNHRYHTHDYTQVDPLLGGNPALRALLDSAHTRGIRVVLDGVFNHASRGFFQFNHILEVGEESPYLDWFTVHGFPLHAYDHEQPPNYDAWIGLHALPELNTANPQVREFIFGVAESWVRFGIDGWRLDVPYEIDDDDFWREFRRRVKAASPDAYIVGEIWHEAQRWLSGDQFDAVMNYIQTRLALSFFGARSLAPLWHGGSYAPLKPIDARTFATGVENMLALYHWEITAAQMNLLSSHDTPRFLTMVQGDQSALRLAMLFQLTMPGVPTIYYGDEIGLTGGYDPGSRGAFPWDEAQWDHDLLAFVRDAITVRRAQPALRRGTYRTLLADAERYAFERVYNEEHLVAAFNTSSTENQLRVPLPEHAGRTVEEVFNNFPMSWEDDDLVIMAEPRSGIVLKLS